MVMWTSRYSLTLALAALASLPAAVSAQTQAPTTVGRMKPVRVIQARVQGDEPRWEPEQGTFVSAFGSTFAERYRAVFDSVNTASVEGALMYVQAEGINVVHNTECKRKNNMKYIVFYELHVLQPDAALDAYDSDATTISEYSPFVAMDSGACTKAGTDYPTECKALYGGDNTAKVGPAVGASMRDTDVRAPYPDTLWFSFPNSCVMKGWTEKDAACRSQNQGGLCAYGSQPDGNVCSFTYKTLGYLKIDDLVGITELTSSVTGKPYSDYTEFCQDKSGQFGGVEFSATTDGVASSVTAMPFWDQPYNQTACRARASLMVEKYNSLTATQKSSVMTPLPTLAALTGANPPCYANSKYCATAPFGCKRELYSQICRVCTSEQDGCVKQSYTLS